MFVGHYAAALALRPLKKAPSLPVLFVGVQLMDILFFPFAATGIEHMRFTPGITAMNNLDLYDMPFSHGLLGVTLQSLIFGLLFAMAVGDGRRLAGGLIAGAAVFSHWVLDVIAHRPDMMLLSDNEKIGAGLWNYPPAAMGVEIALTVGALALYATLMPPRAGRGNIPIIVMGIVMALLLGINWFGPQPQPNDSIPAVAAQGLAAYAILMAIAWWVDRGREREA